jgi:DNA-binding ferritin-like protein
MLEKLLKIAQSLDARGFSDEADMLEDFIEESDGDFLEKTSVPKDKLRNYLSSMRTVHLYHQHAHWISKGSAYYGDHLLFERLYEDLTVEIDALAERAVGLSGDDAVCPIIVTGAAFRNLNKLLPDFDAAGHPDDIVRAALRIERYFLKGTKSLYEDLKSSGRITLGFDDMLMEIYSNHETNVYLLQQRLKSSKKISKGE